MQIYKFVAGIIFVHNNIVFILLTHLQSRQKNEAINKKTQN